MVVDEEGEFLGSWCMKFFQQLLLSEKRRNILEMDLPAPAGSLELYAILNRKELEEERRRWDETLARCIISSTPTRV